MNILARKIIGTRGVTSSQERFSTQNELLDRLEAICRQPKTREINSISFKANSSEVKRSKMILSFVKDIAGDHSANRC
jgi:hypothetical protein